MNKQFLDACRNRKQRVSVITVKQSLSQIWPFYPFRPILRSDEHMYKSNNWLKQHGMPMRRKPFKRKYFLMLDEFHTIS